MLSAATAASAANLKNEGFETGDFSLWAISGEGWRVSPQKDDSYKGKFGAVNDVGVGGGDEYRIVSQQIKVQAGKKYELSVWVRTACIEDTECFLEVQFLDKEGAVLRQFQSKHIIGDQEFTLLTIENMVAPDKSSSVSVRGVVHVLSPPVDNID